MLLIWMRFVGLLGVSHSSPRLSSIILPLTVNVTILPTLPEIFRRETVREGLGLDGTVLFATNHLFFLVVDGFLVLAGRRLPFDSFRWEVNSAVVILDIRDFFPDRRRANSAPNLPLCASDTMGVCFLWPLPGIAPHFAFFSSFFSSLVSSLTNLQVPFGTV